MQWVTIFTTLLPMILQVINKGTNVSKPAFLRRSVTYKRLAQEPDAAPEFKLLMEEMGELCVCLAGCDTVDDQMQLFGVAQDGALAAERAAKGA